jgi:putative ABC transport system ATP-binding protein
MNEKKLAAFRRENLGFVFQDFNLLDNLTIEENIILAMTLLDRPKKDITRRLEEVTTALGIHDILGKYPYQVSGGQKQRCACARALANRPKLILADEPTGALDSKSSRMLLDSLQEMNDSMGATILMVTHDVFSASFCKRILFLRDGEIFHELRKGNKNRKAFLDEIFEVLSLTGGDQ